MKFSAVVAALASSAAAAPFSFPLSNGFPKVKEALLPLVFKNAGGGLPNGPLPMEISPLASQIFSVVALQEILEVAFFSQFLQNLSSQAPGYVVSGESYTQQDLYESIFSIRAQEELHALGANAILDTAGYPMLKPCKYVFPVNSYQSALGLAQTFTDIVIGTLPTAQLAFALESGDYPDEEGLPILVGSILGQEAQQDGAYRFFQGKKPSAAPFIVGGDITFAWSAAQLFIVPGSCPNANLITEIPILPAITLASTPTAADSTLTMSVEGRVNPSTQSFVYLSGQNLPAVEPIMGAKYANGVTTFKVKFPYVSGSFARGLTIGAISKGKTFESTTAVAMNAVYGPALIQVD